MKSSQSIYFLISCTFPLAHCVRHDTGGVAEPNNEHECVVLSIAAQVFSKLLSHESLQEGNLRLQAFASEHGVEIVAW